MAKYRLSEVAANDFEQLFEYGIDNFGLLKAKKYADELTEHFYDVAEHPLHYQAVDHIRESYRRSVYGKHSIYYIITDDGVDIMRILRAENLSTAF